VSWLAHWIFTILGNRNEAGAWYGLWSGFGGALPDVLILTALAGWARHNNCHQHRCWRLGRHQVSDTGVKTCRRHHPLLGAHDRLTGEKIAEIHEGSLKPSGRPQQ
jgi:hypothetical protein